MEDQDDLAQQRQIKLVQKQHNLLIKEQELARLPTIEEPAITARLLKIAEISSSVKFMAGFLIATIIIAALYFGQEILIPLALAILFSFLLHPLVKRLCKIGIPRIPSILLVVSLTLGVLTGLAGYMYTQLGELSQELPQYHSTIKEKLANVQKYISGPSQWDGALSTVNTVESSISNSPLMADEKDNIQQVEVVANKSTGTAYYLELADKVFGPLATAGIIFVFVIFILLDPKDLHDRLLRLLGSNLNVGTDALDEAGQRIGKYLRMQLIVNMSYGVPMAIGLWFIGVPAAIMWGLVAVVMRFIPYVGPLICAVMPLTLAFTVDPTWNMVLWTLALIMTLELITNNIIEPWLYGESTGLSTLAILVAATFWTALWGPIGLILSTPLTACVLVLSSYIPSLFFIKILIGSTPALSPRKRLYQRLVADDDDAALDVALDFIQHDLPKKPTKDAVTRKVIEFYDQVALPAIRLFSKSHNQTVTAEHRLRMHQGLKLFNRNFQHRYPPPPLSQEINVYCLGARWEIDVHSAAMLAHALNLHGIHAQHGVEPIIQDQIQALNDVPLDTKVICISIFNENPLPQIRLIHYKIKEKLPHAKIIVGLWHCEIEAIETVAKERFKIDALVDDVSQLVFTVEALLVQDGLVSEPKLKRADEDKRLAALHDLDLMNPQNLSIYEQFIEETTQAFDVGYAQISWVDDQQVHISASPLAKLEDQDIHPLYATLAREDSICTHVVYQDADLIIEDIKRDPRFSENPELKQNHLRFYAGVPLRNNKGMVLGSLCLLDKQPRQLNQDDLILLHQLADDLMRTLSNERQRNQKLEEIEKLDNEPLTKRD